MNQYTYLQSLETMCKRFIGQKVQLTATFMNTSLPIVNPNLVGDLLEDLFYPLYKQACPDFEEGPKQESPDFFAQQKEFQFEQKAFYGSPGFDIANFTSLIHQMAAPGGVGKKLFKTKYLVFQYLPEQDGFLIQNFWLLNIWDLPTYDNKYPISMQVKKGMWYNIRPGVPSSWTDQSKTPRKFLEKLLECIDQCKQLEGKDVLQTSIREQMDQAVTQGLL
jgi:hypothetical protein